jgi:hypothetical protein
MVKGWGSQPLKRSLQLGGGVWPPGPSDKAELRHGFFFENYTYLWSHFVNFNQTLPKCSLGDPLPKLFFSFLLIYKTRLNDFDFRGLAIRHLICLVTLIINIYGLGVAISTIKKSTLGRGGVWPPGLSYNAFNLHSHPDHKYIWLR